jgi:hypothetical protein
MATKPKRDQAVIEIEEVLRRHYLPDHPGARIDVYRYNSASIRIRIIDAVYKGMDLTERDAEVWDVLQRHLSEDTFSQISLLLLLAPSEAKSSLMNLEFENPTPSRL